MVPMAVIFAPGSVPGDLPRPLPFRDVQEMEISVNRERPPCLSLPRLLVMGGLVILWGSQPARGFTPWQPGAPGTPRPIHQHHSALSWQCREQGWDNEVPGYCREGTSPHPGDGDDGALGGWDVSGWCGAVSLPV